MGLTGIVNLSYPRVISPTLVPENTASPFITSAPEIEDWITFSSQEVGFSIQHPPEMNVAEMESLVIMTKQGPTQRPNTEFHDGISLRFSSGSLEGMSLIELVEQEADDFRQKRMVDEVSSLRFVTVNGVSGYSFDVPSLGKTTHMYLTRGTDGYLLIVNATIDPTNQGFEETVNKMFSTLRIEP